MEQKLVIKTETPPERCEICHQSDLFDPLSGQCSRCNSVFVATAKTEPLKGVQYVNAPVATQNRTARSIRKKKNDFLFLFSLLAFNALTGKILTASKAVWGISFAAIAATYLYERYRPCDLQEDESPEGSKRGSKFTTARIGIFWIGSSFAAVASMIEKGLDFKFIVAAGLFAAGMLTKYCHKFYKANTSKSSADEFLYSQSDVIVKFVESLLLTASTSFAVTGLITSGFSLRTVLLSIVTGVFAAFSWSNWNKAIKVQNKPLPVQTINEN